MRHLAGMTMQPTATMNNDGPKTEAGQHQWWIAIVVIASIPIIQGVVTTPFSGKLQMAQVMIRVFSLVTMAVEIAVIMLALRSGFSVANDIGRFPIAIKLALASLAAIVLFSFMMLPNLFGISALITLRYVLQGMAFAAMIHLIRAADSFDPRRWFCALSAGLFAYIAYIAIFAIFVPDYPDFSWEGMLPSATSVRHIGNYAAILAIAPAALFLFSGGTRKYGFLLCWIAALAFIAWTGSRAAMLGLLVGVLAAFIFTHAAAAKTKWAQLGVATIGGAVISLAFPNPSPAFGLVRTFVGTTDATDLSSGRLELWRHTWQHILQHPWTGHQAGTFGYRMYNLYGYDLDNPHNFVLQYFYDWGFLGGSAALVLIGYLGIEIFQRRTHAAILVFPAVAGMALLIGIGLVEGMLYHPLKMVLVMAMIAPLLSQSSKQLKND